MREKEIIQQKVFTVGRAHWIDVVTSHETTKCRELLHEFRKENPNFEFRLIKQWTEVVG